MKSILLLLLFLLPVNPDAVYVVVTAQATPIDQLTAWQLKQIYFGKLDKLRGTRLQALQLTQDDPLRRQFDSDILGDQADIQDYWLQQKLKGDARPPLTVRDWALLAAYIRRNPGYIGYIPMKRLNEQQGLKVIDITMD